MQTPRIEWARLQTALAWGNGATTEGSRNRGDGSTHRGVPQGSGGNPEGDAGVSGRVQ